MKVPSFQWQLVEGEFHQKLDKSADNVQKKKGFQYEHIKKNHTKVPMKFPLHLWEEVAGWWTSLRWSPIKIDKAEGHSRQVAWLELLLDFEISSGVRCCEPGAVKTLDWGTRSKLLHKIVVTLHKVRGGGSQNLKNSFGVSYAVSTLAPFGEPKLKGLLRRPRFAGGETTTRAIAKTVWAWAQSGATTPSSSMQDTHFTCFRVGLEKSQQVSNALKRKASELDLDTG